MRTVAPPHEGSSMVREVRDAVALVAAYVLLAYAALDLGLFGTLSVWYAPAGLGLALAELRGWRVLPVLAVGELLVGAVVFDVGAAFGPLLLVANAVAYATVLTAGGVVARRLGGASDRPLQRRILPLLALGAAVPLAGALVGVGAQTLAGMVDATDLRRALALWWIGDAIGILTVTPTVLVLVVRARRGSRWWTVRGQPWWVGAAVAVTPALLTLLLALFVDGQVLFVTALFPVYLVIAAVFALPGIALAAVPTSLAVTLVANQVIGPEVLPRTDLQVLLLTLLGTGLGTALVVEQRERLQQVLRVRTTHLEQAQAQAGAGSFVWDVPSDTVAWSDGLCALYGEQGQPTAAADYLLRVHPDEREEMAELLGRTLADGTPYDHVHRAVHADGHELVVRARGQARKADGRVVEVLGTCTDVTLAERTRQHLADALRRERDALAAERAATEQATQLAHVRENLLTAVQHEVRTPLAVVRGLAETLARPEFADRSLGEVADLLARLESQSGRLQRVLADLLDVDRLARGVLAPSPRTCSIPTLCSEVVSQVADRRVVVADVPLDLPEVVVDPALTARILEQLLSNALRHGPPGEPVEVRAGVAADEFVLRVDDRGPGVPEPDRERVFEVFQVRDDRPHSPGTGLGLALVARFAELQGGRAWVTDRGDGPGASFHVAIPVPVPSPHPAGSNLDANA